MMFGATGLMSSIFNRWFMKQPMNARVHSTIFFTMGTFWAGYQYQKWKLMTELGEFKYAVDFAERHSVSFCLIMSWILYFNSEMIF